MRRVLRYVIPLDDRTHDVAEGLPVLCATRNNHVNGPELWVEADCPDDFPVSGPEVRPVQAFGTGHVIPDGAEHLGSCIDGPFVWHLYDMSEVEA